jgi:hypothetical protein
MTPQEQQKKQEYYFSIWTHLAQMYKCLPDLGGNKIKTMDKIIETITEHFREFHEDRKLFFAVLAEIVSSIRNETNRYLMEWFVQKIKYNQVHVSFETCFVSALDELNEANKQEFFNNFLYELEYGKFSSHEHGLVWMLTSSHCKHEHDDSLFREILEYIIRKSEIFDCKKTVFQEIIRQENDTAEFLFWNLERILFKADENHETWCAVITQLDVSLVSKPKWEIPETNEDFTFEAIRLLTEHYCKNKSVSNIGAVLLFANATNRFTKREAIRHAWKMMDVTDFDLKNLKKLAFAIESKLEPLQEDEQSLIITDENIYNFFKIPSGTMLFSER